MLSRDADCVYWMSRYVERAEHVARILLVNSNLLMDVGDLAPALQERQWQGVLTIMRPRAAFGARRSAMPPATARASAASRST